MDERRFEHLVGLDTPWREAARTTLSFVLTA
jgi:hypothetical protein